MQCPTPGDAVYEGGSARNPTQVNVRYRLAGGFDTPGLMAGSEFEAEGLEVRRRARETGYEPVTGNGEARLFGPLARERNGVARLQPSERVGWTNYALDIVGKVFDFGTTVIKGFYAGGGKGYSFYDQPRRKRTYSSGAATPVPGSWEDDSNDCLGDFEQDNVDSPSTVASVARPPNKRRQTDRDAWVLIGTPEETTTSPKRKFISRPSLGPRTSASRPSSRRSLARADSRRTSSFAPRNASPHAIAANLSPEMSRFAKRQARQERVADSMNSRLEDLIRQGQAALGTKYDVEGDGGGGGEDEGFVDEEW